MDLDGWAVIATSLRNRGNRSLHVVFLGLVTEVQLVKQGLDGLRSVTLFF
jgi:hypothetical protein